MIRRIEFILNLEDPLDAEIYHALAGLLRHRRAGSVIRQALQAFLIEGSPTAKDQHKNALLLPTSAGEIGFPDAHVESVSAAQIIDQTASMFGF
jgi:hypothetical protein